MDEKYNAQKYQTDNEYIRVERNRGDKRERILGACPRERDSRRRRYSESGLPLKIGIIVNDKSSSHLSFRTYLNFRLLPSNDRYYLSKI